MLQSAINAVRLLREANKEVTAGQSLLDRPQSIFYFVPQESHSQAGLASLCVNCLQNAWYTYYQLNSITIHVSFPASSMAPDEHFGPGAPLSSLLWETGLLDMGLLVWISLVPRLT